MVLLKEKLIMKMQLNMYKLLVPILILLSINAFAQKDTVINNGLYTVTYSQKYKLPLMVQYKLYKGGGECKRSTLHSFVSYSFTANRKDYAKSGFDQGHMANAEDFAYSCILEALTFFETNVVPQSHGLNAGIFKVYETDTRKLSQLDSLGVAYINIPSTVTIGNGVNIPYCTYKIVQSLTTKKIVTLVKFTDLPALHLPLEITEIPNIEKQVGYKIKLK